MIIIELIYNLSILVSLSIFSVFVDDRFDRETSKGKIFQGFLFGITAIIGMLYPFQLSEGIIFDGRTIVISLCTYFFGPLSGIIATILAGFFRAFLGGAGSLVGVLISIIAFIIGYLFYKRREHLSKDHNENLQLYMLGFFVHLLMLLLLLILPSDSLITVFKTVGFTIIGVFPIVTLVIGKILADQESKKQYLNNLKKSESKFRSLTETSPAAVFIYQGKKFIYINKRSEELTGYKTEELIGKEFWEIVHPDFKDLVKTRGLQRQSGENIPERYQFKISRKTGEARWVDFAVSLIEVEGKPAGMATAYDITTIFETMENLEQQKELFQTTIYSIGDGVIITDTNGAVQQMNLVAENITGYKEQEVKGKYIEEVFNIVNEHTREKVENPVKQVLEEGVIVGLANHTILISKDNNEIPIADSGAPIKTDDGKIIGVVLVFRDQSEERKFEKRIIESETKFRTLVENAFDGIYMLQDKRFMYVNERFCKMTGYTEDELISEDFNFNSILTEKSKDIVSERYLARKRGENLPITYGFQVLAKNGDVKDVELSTVSVGSKDNVSVIGIIRDITDRKKAEEELKQAKERMQVLVEGTPHLFFYVQDSKGDVKYISPSVEIITGYSVAQWLGQHHWFTTDSPINDEARRRTRASLNGKVCLDPVIAEIKHASGDIILLEIYEKPIFNGNEVIGIQGVAHDVSRQKLAEEQLKDLNTKLQTAIEGANIGIWDQDFRTMEVLRMGKWGEMLGFSTEEINNKVASWIEMIHPDDKEYVEQATIEHKKGITKEFKIEHRLRTKDGSYKWILNWGKIYQRDENGKPIKASGIHLDIHDRKLAEIEIEKARLQSEKANQLKSEFLAQISHEIRSPLNAVLNFSQLLEEELKDNMTEEIKISFDGIHSASKRIIRTIDLILNMSELQLGTYEITNREVDLIDVLSKIKIEYSNLARRKNLELKFNSEHASAIIISDEYALSQIFANLVDNAIKYTTTGYIEIAVNKDNGKYNVTVKDTGVGISKEYLPEIFEAFSQEEKGYSRKYEGSGLGLSLVKNYCLLINADISIASEREVGTTFTVKLPA